MIFNHPEGNTAMKKILFCLAAIVTTSLHAGVMPNIQADSDVVVADVENSKVEADAYAECGGKANCQTASGLSVVQASGGGSKGIGVKSTVHVINVKNSQVKLKSTNKSTGKSNSQVGAGIAVSQKSD